MGKIGLTPVERAELNTIRPDGEDGCWVWTGNVNWKGYATSSYRGIKTTLHRLVYLFVNEVTLPSSTVVRHTCDNRRCWNPAHLTTGDYQDNMDDMTARER